MIQHVSREIPPSLLPKCLDFYALLGFEPIALPEGLEGRAVWLARVGAREKPHLHLMLVEQAKPVSGHVAFVVQPYEETLGRLRDAGFEVDPRREHWGAPRAYVRDPASNLVELMAWAPGARPTGSGGC
jgi:catechol 2,3-dioxygenase-like lactoylglutathione lyase family enzyme